MYIFLSAPWAHLNCQGTSKDCKPFIMAVFWLSRVAVICYDLRKAWQTGPLQKDPFLCHTERTSLSLALTCHCHSEGQQPPDTIPLGIRQRFELSLINKGKAKIRQIKHSALGSGYGILITNMQYCVMVPVNTNKASTGLNWELYQVIMELIYIIPFACQIVQFFCTVFQNNFHFFF